MAVIRIIWLVLTVLFIFAVIVIVLIMLVAFILSKGKDERLRDKFGENYEQAIVDEMTPLSCKPEPGMVSQETIKKITGLDFPKFKVESCVSDLRHFTGDYHERCEIQFSEPFDSKTEALIKESERWEKRQDGACSFSFQDDNSRYFWSIIVVPELLKATIDYGGF